MPNLLLLEVVHTFVSGSVGSPMFTEGFSVKWSIFVVTRTPVLVYLKISDWKSGFASSRRTLVFSLSLFTL